MVRMQTSRFLLVLVLAAFLSPFHSIQLRAQNSISVDVTTKLSAPVQKSP